MSIRPMTTADIEPATAAVLADDWGDRRTWFEFAVTQPECHPVIAERDGLVIGTGVGTVNGAVGWVGTIWVAAAERGAGLGRALTQAVIDGLDDAGCATLLLVATETGRLLYERMGFDLQGEILILEGHGLASTTTPDAGVRGFQPDDLPAMIALDADATGEDRSHLLRRLVTSTSTTVVVRDGAVRGFLVRPPWSGGATIAPDASDALALLEARRRVSGPGRVVRTGLMDANGPGLALLHAAGWTDAWSAPRLIRGRPLDWRPESIWGQFSHALG